ncbi:MAG: hypothetical protein V4487_05650, partial [Chlamydiota bacterium]
DMDMQKTTQRGRSIIGNGKIETVAALLATILRNMIGTRNPISEEMMRISKAKKEKLGKFFLQIHGRSPSPVFSQ